MTAGLSEEGRGARTSPMTAQEVAVALGCQVETVYAMARAGTLPGTRWHGTRSWRFHRGEVEAFANGAPTGGAGLEHVAPSIGLTRAAAEAPAGSNAGGDRPRRPRRRPR